MNRPLGKIPKLRVQMVQDMMNLRITENFKLGINQKKTKVLLVRVVVEFVVASKSC